MQASRARTVKLPRLILFIDGFCPRCRRIGRALSRLDGGGRIEVISFRHETRYAKYGIASDDLERRMYAVEARTGRVHAGFNAARAIIRTVPLLWPLVPVLGLASLLGVGDRLYDFLAARRLIIPDPSACAHACEL